MEIRIVRSCNTEITKPGPCFLFGNVGSDGYGVGCIEDLHCGIIIELPLEVSSCYLHPVSNPKLVCRTFELFLLAVDENGDLQSCLVGTNKPVHVFNIRESAKTPENRLPKPIIAPDPP